MTFYPQVTANEALWPEAIEFGYQLLGGGDGSALAPKLPHLGIADILFMSSIMSLPRATAMGHRDLVGRCLPDFASDAV